MNWASFQSIWLAQKRYFCNLRILSIRDEELRKCLGIESLDEILDRRRMNWMEKVAKMPATLTTTDYHVNYLVVVALEVRADQVDN